MRDPVNPPEAEGWPEPPDGYRWCWMPSREVPGDRWEAVTELHRPCRYAVGPNNSSCKEPSVARLDRRRRETDSPRWWHYCGRHLFGRRIRGGQAETRIAVPIAPEVDDA